jgi:CotH kinase protein/Invasin, domain 3
MIRSTCSLVVALACMVAAVPASAAEPVGDPPAAMYEPSTVDVIRLTLPPESMQALEDEPEAEYVEGTFSIATTDGTPDGVGAFSAPALVGIRLKGKYGSYRDLAHKSGFKIKFNFENSKHEKGKKYLGLKKMTLNNMVQDTSQIHERLAYEAFRAAGVPSPRTGYAYLEVNGEDFGLHLNIETTDDVALEKRYGAFQHLYEGAYGSDVDPGGAGSFEIDEGDEEDISDLDALITAVNGDQPADFSDRVQAFADLVEMTRMWAVERYLGHWDGYSTKNNYYLVDSPAGRFQMLPWGTDQTWVDHYSFDGNGGLLFSECLADTSCAALYRKSLRQAQVAIDGAQLDSLASTTATLLAPWQEKEFGNTRREHSPAEITTAVQDTRDFIAARPAELTAWLADKPEAFATHVSLALTPGSIAADGTSTATATATVTDADGDPVPGDFLTFSSSDSGTRFGAVVDYGDGTYAVPVTASTLVGQQSITATDTWASPDVSGVATLTLVSASPLVDGGTGTGAGSTAVTTPPSSGSTPVPTVRITGKPAKRGRDRTPTFRFVSSDPAARFQCKLDDHAFRACSSPTTLSRLALGSHLFAVRPIATGGTGAAASFGFVVKPHRR